MDHIERHPSPERAIEAACCLIDDGFDVYGIGTGPLTDSITRDQIARIYALWVRARYPFGERSIQRRAAPVGRNDDVSVANLDPPPIAAVLGRRG